MLRGVGEVYVMDGGVLEALPHGILTKKKDVCMPPPCIGGWGSGCVVHVRERG